MLRNLQLYNVRSTSCKLQSQFPILNHSDNLQVQRKILFHLRKIYNYNFKFHFICKKYYNLAKLSIKRNLQFNITYN